MLGWGEEVVLGIFIRICPLNKSDRGGEVFSPTEQLLSACFSAYHTTVCPLCVLHESMNMSGVPKALRPPRLTSLLVLSVLQSLHA